MIWSVDPISPSACCEGSTSTEFRTGKRHLDDFLADWLENQEASGLCKTCIANALNQAVKRAALSIVKDAPNNQVKLNVMLYLQETMRAIAAGEAAPVKGSSHE